MLKKKLLTLICSVVSITKKFSPSGNRTPVSRVTGGDTHHYTNEEHDKCTVKARVDDRGRPWLTQYIKYTIIVHLNYRIYCMTDRKQSGAVEACWAHNPEVRGSKPRSANSFWYIECHYICCDRDIAPKMSDLKCLLIMLHGLFFAVLTFFFGICNTYSKKNG